MADNVGIQISSGQISEKTADMLIQILESRADQKTIRAALKYLTAAAASRVGPVSIANNYISMEPKPVESGTPVFDEKENLDYE